MRLLVRCAFRSCGLGSGQTKRSAPATWTFHVSYFVSSALRGSASGLPQFQRLQGVCRGEPARRLECLGDADHLAGLRPRHRRAPTTAWCAAYGFDTNFWSEKGVGGRVCTWLDRTFTADPASADVLPTVADDLLKCLDVLIQSGVAQAHEIEERIAGMGQGRKSA
jgi:hypothetical protein